MGAEGITMKVKSQNMTRAWRASFGLLPFYFCLFTSFAAAQAGESLAPALQAEPSSDGVLTWWLYAPVLKEAAAKPPLGAREGEPVPDTAGTWALHIAPNRFVDFKPLLRGATGTLWAAARIESQSGGKRRLRGGTYCSLKVYRDGQLVLDKPQPFTPYADEVQAEIELPKGLCEITVAVGTRQGFCGFYLDLTEPRAQAGAPPRPNPEQAADPKADPLPVQNAAPRRVPGDKIVIPTAAGKIPDPSDAALRALTFAPSETFVQPGDMVTLGAGLFGSVPCGLGPLSGRFLAPDGKVIGNALPPRPAAELTGRNIWQAKFTPPADGAVNETCTLEVTSGGKLLGVKKCDLFSLRGFMTAAGKLEAEIKERAAKAGRPFPNAALAVEKLSLVVAKLTSGEARLSNDLGATLLNLLASARACAEAEEQGRDPLEGRTGYLERAYISRIDDTPQPYFVQVPSSFKAGTKDRYPLVVFLHGYVPSYDKDRWWTEMPEFNILFEQNSALLAIPFGRSNTDFQACGEVDVLDVIAETKRLYPIDPDRVYLYGYSMGGMAVYHLAAHNPDTFAAGIVMAGRADSPLQNKQALQKFQPYKQWLIHADNPISLCENFLNLPLHIYHGRDDPIISVDEARRMEARLKELGCDAKLQVMPGDHWFGFDVMSTDAPLKWLLSQKHQAAPARDRLKSYSLRYARHGALSVTATNGELKPIEAEWNCKDGTAEVARLSENVLAYSVNGKVAKPLETKGLRKTPRCCGPVREATCGPFIGVYGTSGSPEANARNKKNAEHFAQEWFAFTRSRTALKADKDVTDAEKQSQNLFLFGEEQENLLHAAAAAKGLPFVVKDGSVTIGQKKFALGQTGMTAGLQEDQKNVMFPRGTGFMYIFPSPFRGAGAETSVVICAGIWYGREVGNNHKFDLLPDFILYDDQIDQDATSTNRALCAGFFNGEWKLDEKLLWWAEKQ